MKLNKIILSLLLICSFSYGEAWKEYKGNKVAPMGYIVKVDPYNNEGNYYELFGTVLQRLDANSMLVEGIEHIWQGAKESIIYVEGIPKGTSVTEGGFVNLIVKGDGDYRYTTGFGTQKVVVKAIWQDKINRKPSNNNDVLKLLEKVANVDMSSFSYGKTIKDEIIFLENKKRADLEIFKVLEPSDKYILEQEIRRTGAKSYYMDYLEDKISAIRYIAILFATEDKKRQDVTLAFEDDNDDKPISVIDTWEEFLLNNLDVGRDKVRTQFTESILGIYTNGYTDEDLRKTFDIKASPHKKFNNEGYYYLVAGEVKKVDEDGVFITITRNDLYKKRLEAGVGVMFEHSAREVYIENLPKDTLDYIKNYLKDAYKRYPLVSFIIEGNGLYDKKIPKGTYISGKAYNIYRPK